jgi:hypothetical protein
VKRAAALGLILAILAAGALAGRPAHGQSPVAGPVKVEADPVAMDPTRPDLLQAGRFRYAGGLVLKGPRERGFGGLSDLRIGPDGALTSVSDEGGLLRGRIVLDEHGRLTGLRDTVLEPLTGEDGRPLEHKVDADSEGLAIWPDGALMVSFERRHRIWFYPARGGPPRSLPIPSISMPVNKGLEGLSTAPAMGPNAYWAGVEGGSVWLCRKTRACVRWTGMPGPGLGCRLSALAEATRRRLVILHHCFNPFTASSRVRVEVVRIPPRPMDVAPILAELKIAAPMTVDNLEGVAAVRAPGGGLRLYLISDDNFSDDQRTLLLAFDLPQARQGPRPH